MSRQPSIVFELPHPIVDIPIRAAICVTRVLQSTNQIDNLVNEASSSRLFIRRQDVYHLLVIMHRFNKTISKLLECFTTFLTARDDLVVNICDITNIAHRNTQRTEVSYDRIENN